MFIYCHIKILNRSNTEKYIKNIVDEYSDAIEIIENKKTLKSVFKEAYPNKTYLGKGYSKVTFKPTFFMANDKLPVISGCIFWDTPDIKEKVKLTKTIDDYHICFEFFPFLEIPMTQKESQSQD